MGVMIESLRWLLRWLFRLTVLGVGAVLLMALSAFVTVRVVTLRKSVRVPDFRGKTLEQAMETAERLQLRLDVRPAGTFSETVPPQRIAEQDPPPGTWVKPGRSVEVALSLGRARVQVPDLSGRSLRGIRLTLQTLGLDLGQVLYVQTAGAPDTVLAQDPPPGRWVPGGTAVHLVVNRGRPDTYVMPDVIGRPLEAVVDFFQRKGYRLGYVEARVYPGLPAGIVIGQVPKAGYPLQRHDTIQLTVSRAP
jgi:beta-lactam-binding protein with PASTA domain